MFIPHSPKMIYFLFLSSLLFYSSIMQILKDNRQQTATPSFLSNSAALNLFSSIDDGSGFASVEQVVSIWAWEGVENCKEIFKVSVPVLW